MYNVSITRCMNYNYKNVEKSVFLCLDKLPKINEIIKPGSKVLLKVNLLSKKTPEEAITTHPAIVQAVVKYFQFLECQVIIADSPGAPLGYNINTLKSVYSTTGMTAVAENTGCKLNFDTSIASVDNTNGVSLKKMSVIKIINDVDFVISVAKLKTHTMMMYTGAVKNLFGVIPGIVKMKYHFTLNNATDFANHLVDICEYVKPVLSIIDAIDGMEGNGPSAGDIRKVGLIMASENPYALDLAATHIIGINPFEVPTISSAIKRNLFTGDINDIVTTNIRFSDINIPPFRLPDTSKNSSSIPAINANLCKSCGACKNTCPAKAIDMIDHKPVIDLNKCIRCFCCHELCPSKAVYIEKFYEWNFNK
ncbi:MULTISPECIES: DUF362 domain-containing protein [Clostridium]|uniref:DUF362 domain-containing protein n=1 Tax=Clostridium TaxID=1485 RepID=UPI000A445ED1|nr:MULTISPECIES: DUF362 domain-containing protein [Clostridium]PJI06526.1 hypothetical protein CUB90_00985 [Clostridium sp. CT7]